MGGQNFVTLGPVPDFGNDGLNRTSLNYFNQTIGSSGTIIGAVSGKRIFVHQFFVGSGVNTRVIFNDISTAGATVATQAVVQLLANSPAVFPYSQYPYFTCAPGDAFAFDNSSGTINLFGGFLYSQG